MNISERIPSSIGDELILQEAVDLAEDIPRDGHHLSSHSPSSQHIKSDWPYVLEQQGVNLLVYGSSRYV